MLDALKFKITADALTGNAMSQVRKQLVGIQGAMSRVDERAKRVGRSMRNIGAGMTAGITAPMVLLGKQSLSLYDTQAKAEASVRQGILSTGGAAKKSAADLFKMASGLQQVSNYGDEDILRNLTTPLLTFTNIQGKTFDRAQKATLDMATSLKMDLKSAAILTGKALNDPVKGISALSRSGIQFTDDQKKVIKSLVETGQTAKAQALILGEFEKQFGGQAEAASKTIGGQINQLSMAIGDVKEQLGQQITPFIAPLVAKVKLAVTWFSNLSPEIKRNIVVFGGLAAAAGPVVAGLGLAAMAIGALASPIGVAVAGIAMLVTGGSFLAANWDGLSAKYPALAGAVEGAMGGLKRGFATLSESYKAIGTNLLSGLEQLFNGDLIGSLKSFGSAAVGILLQPFKVLDAALGHPSQAVITWGSQMAAQLASGWAEVKAATAQWVADWLQLGGDLVQSLIDGIKAKWATVTTYVTSLGQNIADGLSSGIQGAKKRVSDAAGSLADSATNTVKDMLGIHSPSRVFQEIGGHVASGFALGLSNQSGAIIGQMKNLAGSVVSSATEGLSALTSFRDGAKQVFDAVLVQGQSFRSALSNVLGGFASNFMSAGINSLFSAFGGGSVPMMPKGGYSIARSFDGGGFTGGGSRSGGIDGRGGFGAILHPNETVVDHTKGQSLDAAPQINISIDARGAQSGVGAEVQAAIQSATPQIVSQAVQAMKSAAKRGYK